MEVIQYTFLLLIIILGLLIFYYKNITDKTVELRSVLAGECPKCETDITELTDIKKGGCGGVDTISVECTCGYSQSFSYAGGSGNCSI